MPQTQRHATFAYRRLSASSAASASSPRHPRPTISAPTAASMERRGWRVYDLPAVAIPPSPPDTVAQDLVYNALDFLQATFTVWPSYRNATPAERRRMRAAFTRAGHALLELVARDDGCHRMEYLDDLEHEAS